MLTLYDRFRRETEEMTAVSWDRPVGRHREVPTMPTLKITVGERDRLDQRTRRRIKAAQQDETLDDSQPVLNFEIR